MWTAHPARCPALLERGFHSPQLVLNLLGVLFAGHLVVASPAVLGQNGDVRPAESGDSLPEVGLQLGVGGERVGVLLERVDLARHLGDVPLLGEETKREFAQVTGAASAAGGFPACCQALSQPGRIKVQTQRNQSALDPEEA